MKLKYILIPVLLLFFAGCGDKDDKKSDSDTNLTQTSEAVLTQNTNAPFTLNFADGGVMSIEKTESGLNIADNSTATLFVFFATWCPPCLAEIPSLNNLQEKYKDELKVVGVLMEDKNLDEINSFITDKKIKYQISIGSSNDTFAKTLGGIVGIPYMVLYYPDGKYARHYFGVIAQEMLDKDIQKVL
ncbi:TlpA family protein disulfide reductase [Campylobacter geochelonis]|uniref:Thiredoxin n=1 Tax=Campylobacter geochelonis TaxID=1780362 RepID=A0A128EIY9_9BACT|nr:TlpA disulfide reductase family protein [Campylobacter geochelonis]QKF71715.1 protein disulfide reductase, TlpA family [Campylobacter geochelonis]CZE47670.1 thiredoxin [Campylobacter geochelonis]CZE48577.1 thiredoxin [Campylobacter geochelonis]CZE51133.1 thiredoxin [Campylobacter geochelonis]